MNQIQSKLELLYYSSTLVCWSALHLKQAPLLCHCLVSFSTMPFGCTAPSSNTGEIELDMPELAMDSGEKGQT